MLTPPLVVHALLHRSAARHLGIHVFLATVELAHNEAAVGQNPQIVAVRAPPSVGIDELMLENGSLNPSSIITASARASPPFAHNGDAYSSARHT